MPDDTEPIERPEAPKLSKVVAVTVPESRSSPAGTRCEGCPKMGGERSNPDILITGHGDISGSVPSRSQAAHDRALGRAGPRRASLDP
jgi:hypothetical protein